MQFVKQVLDLILLVAYVLGFIGIPLGLIKAITHFLQKQPTRPDLLLALKALGLLTATFVLWIVLNVVWRSLGL